MLGEVDGCGCGLRLPEVVPLGQAVAERAPMGERSCREQENDGRDLDTAAGVRARATERPGSGATGRRDPRSEAQQIG